MRRLTGTLLLGAVSLCALAPGFGCALERDPIDRVQPNALPKSFFLGADLKSTSDDPSFYARTTIVDVGFGATQQDLYIGNPSQLAIVKWEISEERLIGRLAYEQIESTDGKGVRPSLAGKNAGQAICAFAIQSHFDIRREYNLQTGEEMNVVGENDRDRPWFDREYIRVDFSKNLIDDAYKFDILSDLGLNGVKYNGLDYAVTDPGSVNAPTFDSEGGYFDVTNKVMATPETVDLSNIDWAKEYGIKALAACDFDDTMTGGKGPWGNCGPAELTVRHSFRRVDANDYQPVEQDGVRFSAFGAFDKERHGYDDAYGMTDQRWHRFVERYDIWERNHYYRDPKNMEGPIVCNSQATTPVGQNPSRDLDNDGTADECAEVTTATGRGGSQCDAFTHKCTLPYQLRKQVPVVWYQTVDSTNEYFQGTEWASHEWDVAMRSAGQVAKYTECVATGGSDCDQYAIYEGQQEENEDAIALAREVDDCRHGASYPDRNRDEARCTALADEVGERRGLSPGVIALAKLQEAVVLCHSPVEDGDAVACGDPDAVDENGNVTARRRLPPGTTAQQCRELLRNGAKNDEERATLGTCRASTLVRFGDLRYQQVMNVEGPQSQGPWGIMADAADPLTGRKISSNITVYTHINRTSSQSFVDQMRYAAGELSTSDVTDGKNVRDYAAAAQAAGAGGFAPMTRDRVFSQLGAAAGLSITKESQFPRISTEQRALAKKRLADIQKVTADTRAASVNQPIYEGRRARAVANGIDADLVTPNSQQLAGVSPAAYTNAMRGSVSQLQGQNAALARQLDMLRESVMEERGACRFDGDTLALAPYSVAAVGDEMQAKFGRFDPNQDKRAQLDRALRMRGYIEQRVHYAVIGHEMGHSMGLRHNFVSSSDAYNYRPQYWQLRTRNGAVSEPCTDLVQDGTSCVGPRYFDPVTQEESKNIQPMFMHSSVMDYPGEFAQDLVGLGNYDFAAVRMFYGDAVAVYKDNKTFNRNTRAGNIALQKLDTFGGLVGWQYATEPNNGGIVHYSQLQTEAKLISKCHEVDASAFRPANWDESKLGVWSPLLDGLIVSVGGRATRCKTQPQDFVPWSQLQMFESPRGDVPAIDSNERVRVPTAFASDNRADIGNAAVFRNDNGADPYEQVSFLVTQAEMMHIFNDYRRGRETFSVRSAATRWRRRTAEKIRDIGKSIALLFTLYPDQRSALISDLRENVLASGMAFDYFNREMTRPESGEHGRGAGGILRANGYQLGLMTVPTGATGYFGDIAFGGAPVESALAGDKGDFDVQYTINAGSYYKKIWTPMLMTESVDKFVSASLEDFVDARYRAVSLADIFPDGYRRWFGNMLTNDDFVRGMRVAADASGMPLIEAKTNFPSQALGTTSYWTPTAEVCFPKEGTTICSDLKDTNTGTTPPRVAVLDPQVGWEVQRFLIAWTLNYLPENQKTNWLNQMDIFQLGTDSDPGMPNRIELHDPQGKVYVARTYGKDSIFGKTVQKGIAARVLEYANDLLNEAYVAEPVTRNGTTWYVPALDENGAPILRRGAAEARALSDYISVIDYLRRSIVGFGYGEPKERAFQ